MGSERVDILPRHPQAIIVIGGRGRIRLGWHVADPRVEQTPIDQWEEVIVEPTNSAV